MDSLAATARVRDRRRVRGDRSRGLVLRLAMDQASLNGLNLISFSSLAEQSGLSKSGVSALFGTKEALQLATIAAARAIVMERVIAPTLAMPAGVPQIMALVDRWLEYSRTRVFKGGCFFAAAVVEVASQDSEARDAVRQVAAEWSALLERVVEDAVRAGDLMADTPAREVGFVLGALLDTANSQSLLTDSDTPYGVARQAAEGALLPWAASHD